MSFFVPNSGSNVGNFIICPYHVVHTPISRGYYPYFPFPITRLDITDYPESFGSQAVFY